MQFVRARSPLTQHWDPEKTSQQMYSFLWPKRWSPSLLPAALVSRLCPITCPDELENIRVAIFSKILRGYSRKDKESKSQF